MVNLVYWQLQLQSFYLVAICNPADKANFAINLALQQNYQGKVDAGTYVFYFLEYNSIVPYYTRMLL